MAVLILLSNIKIHNIPGGLQFMGSQRVGHNWPTKHSTVTYQIKLLYVFSPLHNFQHFQSLKVNIPLVSYLEIRKMKWCGLLHNE